MHRVLHITNIPTPYRLPQLNAMARQFADVGWQLRVLFGGTGYARRKWKVDLAECEFDYAVLAGALTSRTRGRTLFLYNGLYPAIRSYRPDVVISTGYSLATLKVMLWSGLVSVPYLIFSGSTLHRSGDLRGPRAMQRRLLVRRAAGAVAYGTRAKEYLVFLGAREEHIHIAINTGDLEFFRTRTLELRASGARSNTTRTLLYIGDLTVQKRPEAALHVLAQLKRRDCDCHLVMVGDGPRRAALAQLSRELGVERSVAFEGYRQKADLPRYLAAADCFLFPTRDDVWGLVLNEAMAAGVPCIASAAAGATVDLIRDGVTGFVADFNDVEGVTDRVEWLLTHSVEGETIGRQASEHVTRRAGLQQSAAGFVNAVLDAYGRR